MMLPQLSILRSSSLERCEGGAWSVISSVTSELARLRPSGTFSTRVTSLSEPRELFLETLLAVFMLSAEFSSSDRKLKYFKTSSSQLLKFFQSCFPLGFFRNPPGKINITIMTRSKLFFFLIFRIGVRGELGRS